MNHLMRLRKERDELDTEIERLEIIEAKKMWVRRLSVIRISKGLDTVVFTDPVNVEKLKALILSLLGEG